MGCARARGSAVGRLAVSALACAGLLAFAAPSAAAATNDAFAAAEPLPGWVGSVSTTTLGTTRDPGEPLHSGRLGKGTIWYRWRAGFSGTVDLAIMTVR